MMRTSVLVILLFLILSVRFPIHASSNNDWILISSDETGFYPGQIVLYNNILLIPFGDPAEYYIGVLVVNKTSLDLIDYYTMHVNWSPNIYKSFLLDNELIIFDKAGFAIIYNLTSNEIDDIYMFVNKSRGVGVLVSDVDIDEDGDFYVVTWGGRYYAYSTITKFEWNGTGFTRIWSSEVDVWNLPGNILVHGDRVYFVTTRGIYVFNAENGEILAARRFIIREPYAPANFTMWWSRDGLNLLVYLHNKTASIDDYDLTVHLVLDENLNKRKEETLIWADTREPAILCYFMYTDYPFVSGGGSLACYNPARVIDVDKWIAGWFYKSYLMMDKGIDFSSYTASATYDDEYVYLAVRADTFRIYTLLLFKAPKNLAELNNDTMLAELMTVYRLVLEPSNYVGLVSESSAARYPEYIAVERLLEKHYEERDVGIKVYHTLCPEEPGTSTTSSETTTTHTSTVTNATTKTTTLTSSITSTTSYSTSTMLTSSGNKTTTAPTTATGTVTPSTTRTTSEPRTDTLVYATVAGIAIVAGIVVVFMLLRR